METHNQQGAGTRGAGRKFALAGTSRGNGTEAARERARERMDAAFRDKPAKPWKPKDGEKFFCVCGDGEVCFVDFDEGFENDKEYIEFGNCFRTRDEAEAARERVHAALKGATLSEKEMVDLEDLAHSLRSLECLAKEIVSLSELAEVKAFYAKSVARAAKLFASEIRSGLEKALKGGAR